MSDYKSVREKLVKDRNIGDISSVEYFVHLLFKSFDYLPFFVGVESRFLYSEKVVVEVKLAKYHLCVENVVLIDI